ncbi:MAG: hypothetical protein ACE5HV_03240 [Acidobacteriota bacterium]
MSAASDPRRRSWLPTSVVAVCLSARRALVPPQLAFLEAVRENEEVKGKACLLVLADELEKVLSFSFLSDRLYIGDPFRVDGDLAQQPFAADYLDIKDAAFDGEVPVEVVVIVEDALLRAGAQYAVGVAEKPVPKCLEGHRGHQRC